MAALDKHIDDLYTQPLDAFTAARNALAKTLAGDDRARVKSLDKPTLVAWAVNQVYWHARPVFDRCMKAGERLRHAQIAALTGKKADVREATGAHRTAVAAAVKEAERLASAVGSRPSPDALARTFESLSLAADPPPPGRLTAPLQPSGFEALAGVTPSVARPKPEPSRHSKDLEISKHPKNPKNLGNLKNPENPENQENLENLENRRASAARVAKAQAALTRAQAAERLAHDAWLRSQQVVDDARQELTRAKSEA